MAEDLLFLTALSSEGTVYERLMEHNTCAVLHKSSSILTAISNFSGKPRIDMRLVTKDERTGLFFHTKCGFRFEKTHLDDIIKALQSILKRTQRSAYSGGAGLPFGKRKRLEEPDADRDSGKKKRLEEPDSDRDIDSEKHGFRKAAQTDLRTPAQALRRRLDDLDLDEDQEIEK